MKNVVFVFAVLLLAFSLSASAAETPKAAPETTVDRQIEALPPLLLTIKPLTPYCHTLDGASCSPIGSTTPCTDVCFNQLSCTCYSYHWYCNLEC